MTVAVLTRDVSDKFLTDLSGFAKRVNVPGHYLLEVWNSESGMKPLNPTSGHPYFGPAEVLSSIIAKSIDPTTFSTLNLEQRLPYMEKFVRDQVVMNHGVAPNRPEVYYALNFVPARVYAAGANPSGSTVIVDRNGQFWDSNPAMQKWADSSGVTINSLGRLLQTNRLTSPRVQELLARYSLLNDEPYPGTEGVVAGAKTAAKGYVLFVGLGLIGAAAYYVYKKGR
jgi:hypothetical protein